MRLELFESGIAGLERLGVEKFLRERVHEIVDGVLEFLIESDAPLGDALIGIFDGGDVLVHLGDALRKLMKLGDRRVACRTTLGARGQFSFADRAGNKKRLTACRADGILGGFARAELSVCRAVAAKHAEVCLIGIGRRLVRLVEQARRLIVERRRQLVSQEIRQRVLNAIDAVVGEVGIALENIGRRLEIAEQLRQLLELDRVVVAISIFVGVKDLHLREIQERLDRVPNGNGRGDALSLVLKNLGELLRRQSTVKIDGGLGLVDAEGKVVEVVHGRRPRIIARVGDGVEVGKIFGNLTQNIVGHKKFVERVEDGRLRLGALDFKALLFISRLDGQEAQSKFLADAFHLRLSDDESAGGVAAKQSDIAAQLFNATALEIVGLDRTEFWVVDDVGDRIAQRQLLANFFEPRAVDGGILFVGKTLFPLVESDFYLADIVGRIKFDAEHLETISSCQFTDPREFFDT